MVLLNAYDASRSSLIKSETEIATDLITGGRLPAYFNQEHAMSAEKAGGLPPKAIQALIAGLLTSFDDPAASRP